MSKLRIILLVTAVLIITGCNRGWTRGWLRGDLCNTCGSSTIEGATTVPPAQLPEPLP